MAAKHETLSLEELVARGDALVATLERLLREGREVLADMKRAK